MRLDQFLQQQFQLESRHQAQRLILEGVVSVNGKVINKNSHDVESTDKIEILDRSILQYVSRGGLKLKNAMIQTAIHCKDYVCLDVGQSTGGFTDCLLQQGAKKIYGIEVGHGQLHESLRGHPQVNTLEKTHILDVLPIDIEHAVLDLIVVDVSFISLSKILRKLKELSTPNTKLLALVKPQFELNANYLNKAGIVKDPSLYKLVEDKIKQDVTDAGFRVLDYFHATPQGSDGNQEFFIFASI